MCTPHARLFRADARSLLTRRGFLRASAGTAAGIMATGRVAPAFAQDAPKYCVPTEQISLQLYTMREDMGNDLDGTLKAIADIGFKQVEHAGYDQADGTAEGLKAALDAAGLQATSGHRGIPYPWDPAAMEELIEDALLLGAKSIVEPLPNFALAALVGGIFLGEPPVSPVPGAVWADYARTLNLAGEMAAEAGLRVGYHNHNPEFQPLPEGGTGYDVLINETDPDLVHFELDLYWSWAGGKDPVELMEEHPTRFRQFHVKDMDESGGITAPGTGTIDFDRIFVAAAENGAPIEEYTIEQDNAGTDSVNSARLGYELLTGTCAAPAPIEQEPEPAPPAPEPPAVQDTTLPATGGGLAAMGALGIAAAMRLRKRG